MTTRISDNMQLNWWVSGDDIVARDTDGKLTTIGTESDDERVDWLKENEDLLEMDELDPVVQTGKSEELVLMSGGKLLHRRPISSKYDEIDEFGPIIALHDDVIETSDGNFYKCEWNGDDVAWRPHEPIETSDDSSTYIYEGAIEPWHTDQYTAICDVGVVTIVEEFIPKDGPSQPGWEYRRTETTFEMDVIDYCDGYLLCSNGDVFCMLSQRVIQRIMIHQRSRKSAI